MGLLSLLMLPFAATLAIGQTAPADATRANLSADRLTRNGALVQGRGHVRARAGGLVFQADEATLRSDTGELELRENVLVTLPARADKSVFRFGSGISESRKPHAIVTGDPVALSASQMVLKDGVLHATGNIVVRAADPEVHGDEMSMALRTADATVTGRILTAGRAGHEGNVPEMPPEIVK